MKLVIAHVIIMSGISGSAALALLLAWLCCGHPFPRACARIEDALDRLC